MSEVSELDMARLVGPVIDRLRGAVSARLAGQLMAAMSSEQVQLTPRGGQLFGMLRNTYPTRRVPLSSWRAVFTYLPEAETDAAVQEIVAKGLVATDADFVCLSAHGQSLMEVFHRVASDVVTELWANRALDRALEWADRALTTALRDAGPTLAVMAPPYDPPGASSAVRLAERLTGLRFDRYDSHIAAWTAAGATAHTVQDLPPELRAEVEQETNRRAGLAYSDLDGAERLELLSALAALPG